MRLVAVPPVYDELRQQRAGKLRVDVRQAQDIKDICIGLPVFGNAFGLGAVFQAGGVFGPLDTDVLDKFRIELLGTGAALAPVQDEFGNRLFDKVRVDFRALHDFHGVSAGSPVIVQDSGRWHLERLRLALLVSPPERDNMLAKLVFPGVAGFSPLPPVKGEIFQLVQCELARYVVVQAQQL